jgi:hypothetical protein
LAPAAGQSAAVPGGPAAAVPAAARQAEGGQNGPAALDWYQAPPDWRPQDLPASLDAFITVLTGRLFTRP